MPRSRSTTLAELLTLTCALGCATTHAPAPPAPKPGVSVETLLASARAGCRMPAAAAERQAGYADAQRAHVLAPQDREVALALARCAYLQADLDGDEQRVLSVAEQGAKVAKQGATGPDDAQASYLRAVNLGLYVRAKGMSALGRLSELVTLLRVAGHEPAQDEGGPWRVLGLLYVRAPAWPVGPGDVDLALDLLGRAAREFPQHPLNHLYLAEALMESGDRAAARVEVERARELCTATRFGDWAVRWRAEADALETKLK